MAELRRKLGSLWLRKNRADIPANGTPTGSGGLGNSPLGDMPLGGS